MGIINDQAKSVTATVQATAVTYYCSRQLPISKYLRKFLQQEDVPQQDLTETQHVTEFPQQENVTETQQHVTEFSQQEVSEPTPKKRPTPEEQPIPQQEPPKKRSKIDRKPIPK